MKAVCMMTGAVLALGTVVPQMSQAVPEAVREEAPRIQVSSTDEFIKVFLTEKLIGRDGKETSRQIETVSETNYASVLAGRDFLKTADPKLKKTIEDGLEQKKIDWKAWCESAETLRKKLEPEKTDKQPESEPKTEDRNQDSALGTGQTGKPDSQTPGALQTEKPAENIQAHEKDPQNDAATGPPPAMHRLRPVHLIPAQRHRMQPETSKPVRMKTLTVRTVRILPDRRRRSRFPQNRNSLIPGRMLMAGRILPVPKKTRWMLIPGPRIHPERNRSPDPEQRKAMFCLPVKTRQPRLFQKDSRMIRLWTQAKRQTLLQHRQPATQTGKPV